MSPSKDETHLLYKGDWKMAVHFLYETKNELGGFKKLFRHRFAVTDSRVTIETYEGHCLKGTNYLSVKEARVDWQKLINKGATQKKEEK